MKADTNNLATIFGRDVRYLVPLYQRPYVWTRDKHWAPLWADVLWVLERLDGPPPQDGRHSPHFLGAIVLEQQGTQLHQIDARTVIDGQQRLTTLQLFIAAAAAVATERGYDVEARLLEGLTKNNPDLVKSDEESFKVWPTNANRGSFRAVMTRSAKLDDPNNLIHEAYSFFVATIDVWAGEEDTAGRFEKLVAAVRTLLKLVVIDLEEEDDAQVIFESLNARGTPLLAVDLVKNLVFQRASRSTEELDLDRIYEEQWAPFDLKYWRAEIVQGRLRRPRAELFLMHWLTMKLAEEIHAQHLYEAFKKLLASDMRPVADVITEFSEDRDVYQRFDAQPAGSVAKFFFERLDALDTTTALPIALMLFRQDLPVGHRDGALKMIESWLVRRMLCRLTAQGYNRLFVDLVKLLNTRSEPADEVVYEFLRSSDADSARWPDDDELTPVLNEAPLYRLVRKRLVMVLSALEIDMRGEKAEPIDIPASLWVEHVLPQKWQAHWPVADGDFLAAERRNAHVHRLGNLTLVTGKLNAAMSNAAWKRKRTELNKHGVLLLNSRLIAANPDVWSEETIMARGAELAERIVSLWPGPQTSLAAWRAAGVEST